LIAFVRVEGKEDGVAAGGVGQGSADTEESDQDAEHSVDKS